MYCENLEKKTMFCAQVTHHLSLNLCCWRRLCGNVENFLTVLCSPGWSQVIMVRCFSSPHNPPPPLLCIWCKESQLVSLPPQSLRHNNSTQFTSPVRSLKKDCHLKKQTLREIVCEIISFLYNVLQVYSR